MCSPSKVMHKSLLQYRKIPFPSKVIPLLKSLFRPYKVQSAVSMNCKPSYSIEKTCNFKWSKYGVPSKPTTVSDFDEKTKTNTKTQKPILKLWSVFLVLENIFISFLKV